MDSFEFVSSKDSYLSVHASTPLYITNAQRLKVEYNYQKSLNVLYKYLYSHQNDFVVLEYLPRLHKEDKVVAINIKTMKEQILEYADINSANYLDKKLEELYINVTSVDESEVDDDSDFDYFYEV